MAFGKQIGCHWLATPLEHFCPFVATSKDVEDGAGPRRLDESMTETHMKTHLLLCGPKNIPKGVVASPESILLVLLMCSISLAGEVRAQSNSPGGTSGGIVADPLGTIYASIQDSEYQINWQPEFGAYMTPNRANNLRFLFLDNGFMVTPRDPKFGDPQWSASFQLDYYGREGFTPSRLAAVSWSTSNNTALASSDGMVVDYSNTRAGMRQSFLLLQRPPGPGSLSLVFGVTANMARMVVDPAGKTVYLVGGEAGTNVLMFYSDLNAFDSTYSRLAASIVPLDVSHFAIVVDDATASYPVLIDPLSGYQTGGWEVSPNSGSQFGFSLAYVTNYPGGPHGNLLVGAPYFDPGTHPQAGKVFLFDPAGGGLPTTPNWTYAGNQSYEHLGWSVSDGGPDNSAGRRYGWHNLLVGAPGYNSGNGAAFAFYPSYGGYVQLVARLDGNWGFGFVLWLCCRLGS